jgi:alkaline phosphatase D
MFCLNKYISIVTLLLIGHPLSAQTQAKLALGQGMMTGEVSMTSVILQTRLTAGDQLIDRELPGHEGRARFEISLDPNFKQPIQTAWQSASPELDHLIKSTVKGLIPGQRYYYRVEYGPLQGRTQLSNVGNFKTHGGAAVVDTVRFAVVTGMNWHKFHLGTNKPGGSAIYGGKYFYTGPDKHLGFPALESMLEFAPDYFVGTGDNVYYDGPRSDAATTAETIRRKYHEQFVQPRFKTLFQYVSTYWEKDDHDHRFNDCDNTGDKEPSPELGIRMFREQLPVVDLSDPLDKTYRTYRINKDLQVWFTENRDYRSPNSMPDGPEKTIWGAEQKAWLMRTLEESDATFKILISPTPIIGPDDAYKTDNHVNHQGFRTEGEEFLSWLKQRGFLQKKFYIVCGDRHWQYHSVHPTGFQEFSTGALVDNNARIGRSPGDPESTDPDGKIRQSWLQSKASGGFLIFEVLPKSVNYPARLVFNFNDVRGNLLYSTTKVAR